MIIYHGSKDRIEQPEYGKGKPYNDYGRGFYCTEDIEMAKEWSCGEDHDGFANIYEIHTEGLKILNLNDDDFTILHWLTVLLKNSVDTKVDGHILNLTQLERKDLMNHLLRQVI